VVLLPAAVAALGDAAGVWTRRQALAAGLTAHQIDALLANGSWQTLQRGIYTDGGTTPHPVQRAGGACLAAGKGSVAAGRTAARVHRFPLIDDDDPATGSRQIGIDEVVLGDGVHRATRGRGSIPSARLLLPSQELLLPGDITRVSGVRVMSQARTLFWLARELTFEAAVAATDHALRTRAVTKQDLWALADRLAGRRGVIAFRRVIAFADDRAETALESVTRVVVTAPDLPPWTPQLKVRSGGRILARVDLGNEQLQLAVEADGGAHHSGPAVAKDRMRDEVVGRLDWHAVHVTWFDARMQPAQVRARVRTVAGERARLAG
jgi:hypothetical protein